MTGSRQTLNGHGEKRRCELIRGNIESAAYAYNIELNTIPVTTNPATDRIGSMITSLSVKFREDLAQVYGTLQSQPLSAAFLSDLVEVHATLPAMYDANFRYLAERFHQWRTLTKEFVRDHLLHLTDDDPLRCPISLFRTMDYGRLETAHTRTLAWLLDPGNDNDAEHGFGHTLIKALLKRVAERDDLEGVHVDRVKSEHSFDDSGRKGRLDILAEGEWQSKEEHVQWVLAIEAKVDAWEGEGQLLKYDKWLRSYAGVSHWSSI